MNSSILCTLAAGLMILPVNAAGAVLSFKSYDVIQFINLNGPSPTEIMRLDSNGELLLACEQPCSRESVRSKGVDFSESQVYLLKLMGLIKEDGGLLVTAFPILDEAATLRLRTLTTRASAAMLDQVTPPLVAVQRQLESRYPSHAFAILFGLVLDGLVWQELNLLVPESAPEPNSPTNPYWSGRLWAVSPKRADKVGTNTDYESGYVLYVVWSAQAKDALAPLAQPAADVHLLLRQLSEGGAVTDAATRAAFSQAGLVDDSGKPLIPVISRTHDDPLYKAAQTLAATVARATVQSVDLAVLAREFHLPDRRFALDVAYHELIWDLLALLEARGVIARPLVLTDSSNRGAASAASLAFIVCDGKNSALPSSTPKQPLQRPPLR